VSETSLFSFDVEKDSGKFEGKSRTGTEYEWSIVGR
jgi:hypothetical protein